MQLGGAGKERSCADEVLLHADPGAVTDREIADRGGIVLLGGPGIELRGLFLVALDAAAVFKAQPQRTDSGSVAELGRLREQRGRLALVAFRAYAHIIAIGEIKQPRRVVVRQPGEAAEGLLGVARLPAEFAERIDAQLKERGRVAAFGRRADRAEPVLLLLGSLQKFRREEDDLLRRRFVFR